MYDQEWLVDVWASEWFSKTCLFPGEGKKKSIDYQSVDWPISNS
jgi:hypothetical protein